MIYSIILFIIFAWLALGMIAYTVMLKEHHYFDVIEYNKFQKYFLVPIIYLILGGYAFCKVIKYLLS